MTAELHDLALAAASVARGLASGADTTGRRAEGWARPGGEPAAAAWPELNAEQRAAVAHPAQGEALLVIAGAGAGKTATLAARAAKLIADGLPPARLLLLAFSRRAAAEMQRRVGHALHQTLGPSGHGPQLQGHPWAYLPWCGTFHSVAARLLREYAAELGLPAGFTVLDRGDAEDLMGLERERLGLAARAERFPLPATCLAIHSRALNTGRPLAEVLVRDFPWCQPQQAALESLLAAFGAAKRAQHSLDYDDLLLAWWHLVREPSWAARLAARFDAVLVDEAQDINHLQAEIVQRLRPNGRGLTLVGDDAQAIYGFRGAEQRHLLDFPSRHVSPPARVLLLERSYRATPPLLAASNGVIALAARRFAKTMWTDRHVAGERRPALRTVADEAAQAEGVAEAVLEARERGLPLARQAVLFRTAHHSLALELELARRRIPFVKHGGLRFMESAHVKDVLALLRWASNPLSELSAWRVARLVPGFGPASARRVVRTLATPRAFAPPAAAAVGWKELQALLAQLRASTARWPEDLHLALAWYRPQLERLHDDAAVRWLDLQQLAALAPSHGSRERFVTELALDPPAASGDEAGDPSLDEDPLVLSTIHSAKGQEWQSVHVLNVVDGCMPADLATGHAEEIEEERRLLYVAMTRARDELTLWVPQRFYVTNQRALGDRHLYALRSRFIPDELLGLFDTEALATKAETEGDAPRDRLESTALGLQATEPCPGRQTGKLAGEDLAEPKLNLMERLFSARPVG